MNGIDLKRKLRAGEVCLGAWVTLADPLVPEVMSHLGFDWLLIDTEHAPIPLDALQTMILMTQRGGTPALVRVPANEAPMIKQALDVGAEGVVVPLVNSAEDARQAVAHARYPPAGRRGWGPRAAADFGRRFMEYTREANDRIVLLIQIEHVDAVQNLEGILAVPGLDGALIGPGDLSFSMGIPGQWDHPDLIAVMQDVARRGRAAGVPVGVVLDGTVEEDMRWIERGMQFVTLGLDWGFMCEAASLKLNGMRRALQGRSQ